MSLNISFLTPSIHFEGRVDHPDFDREFKTMLDIVVKNRPAAPAPPELKPGQDPIPQTFESVVKEWIQTANTDPRDILRIADTYEWIVVLGAEREALYGPGWTTEMIDRAADNHGYTEVGNVETALKEGWNRGLIETFELNPPTSYRLHASGWWRYYCRLKAAGALASQGINP